MIHIEEMGVSLDKRCPKCDKIGKIIHCEVNGFTFISCRECLFDTFGYGRPHRDFDHLATYKKCSVCGAERLKKEERDNQGNYVGEFWSCDICGYIAGKEGL